MRRLKGQVTVFLALSALSLFALFSVCLESARYACLDYLCSQAADSSLKSVFAAFQGDMVRDFGLLMCRGKEGEEEIWTESFREYAEKYWQPGGERAYGDRLRLKDLEVQALDSVYITEGHGRVFSNEVLTYMKTAGLSILLKEALERMGLYQEEEGEGFLETIQNMLGDKDSSLDGILDSYKNIKEQAKELQEKARKEAEEGDEEYQPPPGNSEDVKTDLLEQIKAIRKNGLIGIITGNAELSNYSWNQPDLPSHTSLFESLRHPDYAPGADSLLDHLLMGEFLQHKMGNYLEQPETGGRYETEYVLSGNMTDKKSLEQVIGEILLIRIGFNLAYLMTDSEKLAAAELTAIGIMSLLALPQLILILKWILVSAWALAESIVDLRGLVRGKKIPIWKTKASWKLSAMKLDLAAEGGGSKGLSYEDYLRILFCLGNPRDKAYRMMDVIQARMRLKIPDFTMREYMVYASASLEIGASSLYIDAPLVRNVIGEKNARRFSRTSKYGYGRR